MRVRTGKNILVHKGFLEQFLSIELAITTFLKNDPVAQTLPNMLVAGHSLGGGNAHIAAPFYGEMFNGVKFPKKRIVCHTFGSPRTGNWDFVQWFHEHVAENFRVANYQDPIPTIPFRPLWHHVMNTCIVIKEVEGKNKFLVGIEPKDVSFWIRVWAPLLCITTSKLLVKSFPEHNTGKYYIPRLKSFVDAMNEKKVPVSETTVDGVLRITPATESLH